jgi:membrane-bound lytic murein transglycosylase B
MNRYALALLALLALPADAQQADPSYASRPEVQRFMTELNRKHGIEIAALQSAFEQARFQQSVIKAITPQPPGQRSWRTYRDNFIIPRRIEGGLQFKRDYAAALEKAEAEYGVPREIIVAIIGVETEYGRNMGWHRVLDALTTLAFDYPRRAEYFSGELEEFFVLAREANLDVTQVKGSFAGAIGLPQFMPSSIRRHAVDFDGDGRRDLRNSPIDAIGSVANFLSKHGWVAGAPVAFSATAEGEEHRALIDGGVAPNRRADELRAAKLRFDTAVADDTPVVLIELESPDAPAEYRVGLQNFYVLTRYNRSSFYANAVLELAQALRQ